MKYLTFLGLMTLNTFPLYAEDFCRAKVVLIEKEIKVGKSTFKMVNSGCQIENEKGDIILSYILGPEIVDQQVTNNCKCSEPFISMAVKYFNNNGGSIPKWDSGVTPDSESMINFFNKALERIEDSKNNKSNKKSIAYTSITRYEYVKENGTCWFYDDNGKMVTVLEAKSQKDCSMHALIEARFPKVEIKNKMIAQVKEAGNITICTTEIQGETNYPPFTVCRRKQNGWEETVVARSAISCEKLCQDESGLEQPKGMIISEGADNVGNNCKAIIVDKMFNSDEILCLIELDGELSYSIQKDNESCRNFCPSKTLQGHLPKQNLPSDSEENVKSKGQDKGL